MWHLNVEHSNPVKWKYMLIYRKKGLECIGKQTFHRQLQRSRNKNQTQFKSRQKSKKNKWEKYSIGFVCCLNHRFY